MIPVQNVTESAHPTTGQLFDFISGRCPPSSESDELESHLESCALCQEIALRAPLSQIEARLAASIDGTDNSATGQADQLAWKLNHGYQISDELGRGASGIVYRALHPGLKREVALKLLIGGTKSQPRQLTRFRREAYALARLSHPNIVTIFDSGEQDGVPYLAMELVEDGSLADVLRTGPLEVMQAARLTHVLATALTHAHQCGVLHRDLKPHNILLAKNDSSSAASMNLPWCPKLVDFGLARFEEMTDGLHTRTGEFLGTPEYMPPEMIQTRDEAMTAAVDIYGLGAILYECLTGRPPFQGSSIAEISHQVAHFEPPSIRYLRPGVPRDLETICLRCLNKSPQLRFESTDGLTSDLSRFLNGESIRSKRPGFGLRCWRWCRRNPWRAVAILSTMALCLSFPAVGLYYGARMREQARVASNNYEATRASLWQVLDHVQKSAGGEIPKLTQLSLAQAKDARDLFKRLQQQDPNPRATMDLIKADLLVASLAAMLGQLDDSALDLNAARDLCEQLHQFPEERDEALSLQAAALNKLATITMGKDTTRALEYQSAALDIHTRLAQSSGDSFSSRDDLAWSHHTLGSIYLLKQAIPEAIEHYQQSIQIRQQLENEQGKSQALSHAIAGTLVNLALTESNLGHLNEAEGHYREAIDRFRWLRQSDRAEIANPQLLGDWSSALLNYATLIGNQNRASESVTLCSEAIDVLTPALAREPNVALLRDNLFKLCATRAQLYMFQGSFDQAAKDWHQCLQTTHDPAWKRHSQIQLLVAQAQSSEYRQALSDLDAMMSQVKESKTQADYSLSQWQLIVLVPVLAFEAAGTHADLSDTQRFALAEACCERVKSVLQLSKQSLSQLQSVADMQASHWTCLKAALTESQWESLQ